MSQTLSHSVPVWLWRLLLVSSLAIIALTTAFPSTWILDAAAVSTTVRAFSTTQYQSAFQLAAGLNIGFVVLWQLRESLQSSLRMRIELLQKNLDDTNQVIDQKKRVIEARLMRLKSIKLELKQSTATHLMLIGATLSTSIIELNSSLAAHEHRWSGYDDMLKKFAFACLFISIFGLGITTYLPNFNMENEVYAGLLLKMLALSSLAVFFPLIISYVAGFFIHRKLEQSFSARLAIIERDTFHLTSDAIRL